MWWGGGGEKHAFLNNLSDGLNELVQSLPPFALGLVAGLGFRYPQASPLLFGL